MVAPAHAQFADCNSCTVSFSLTRKQVLCVKKRLDNLLRRNEPVYFDASNCDQSHAMVMSPTFPILKDPTPAPIAKSLWLELTNKQLQCLRHKLSQLQNNHDDPIAISLSVDDCASETP
jgi:hypothetical protein